MLNTRYILIPEKDHGQNGSPGVEFKYDYQKRIYYRVVGYKARVPEPSYRPQAFEKDFDCWTLNGIEFNFGLIISGDITLVAKYKETSSTTG